MGRMAVIHAATLRPTKLELLAGWLPGRDWYAGPPGEPVRVAAFRFDDPAGAVGIETILVRVGGGPVHQVPLTYRDAPLAGHDDLLLGTAEHSVLGKRWIYDATGDPVYAQALASAVLGGTGQAEEVMEVDGRPERREPSMGISGGGVGEVPAVGSVLRVVDGDPVLIVTDAVELTVVRRPGPGTELTGTVLRGTWPGQEAPVPLASAVLASR
jgi:hypothetical protein